MVSTQVTTMGLRVAFTEGAADFSRMFDESNAYIEQVSHVTALEVNEEGSEAAAATAVTMMLESCVMSKSMRVDRPFVVAIEDSSCDHLLFLGAINDPGAKE